MTSIAQFTQLVRLTMPDLFSSVPVLVKGQKSSVFNEYRFTLPNPLTIEEVEQKMEADQWIQLLYHTEPKGDTCDGKSLYALYDYHLGVMCTIFATTYADNLVHMVYVKIYHDLYDFTDQVRSAMHDSYQEDASNFKYRVSLKKLITFLT